RFPRGEGRGGRDCRSADAPSACRGPRHADGASALRQTPRPGRAVPADEELDRPLSYDRGPHPRPWRNKKMRLTNEQQVAWERDGFLGIEELFQEDEIPSIIAEVDSVLAEVREEARAAGRPVEQILASGVYVGLSVKR